MSDAMLAAIEKRSLNAIQAAVAAGASIDTTDGDGYTALARMCKSKSGEMSRSEVEAALWLIANGADVMKPNKDTETPLHLAARAGNLEIINALVAKGATIAKTKLLYTPLHYCFKTHDKNVAVWDRLLELGCGIDDKTKWGDTPLFDAIGAGNATAVKYLLAKGADRDARDAKNRTPLDKARDANEPKIAKLLER